MKTFIQWAKVNKKNLSVVEDVVSKGDVATDSEDSEKATSENRARTGWSGNYPPAYFSGQYPQKYVNPKKSTADLDAEHMKKK